MYKIPIHSVSDKAKSQKGFEGNSFGGCLNCPCGADKKGGACCRFGCEVDKESYDLILAHKAEIEPAVQDTLENCFNPEWVLDPEYLGGSYIRSKVRPSDGYCVFHTINGKGCELARLVLEKNISRRMIPTICRLYPLSWDKGKLFLYDELYSGIEVGCNVNDPNNNTTASLMETQKGDFDDIFEFKA